MANQTVTVFESDGVTTTDVEVLGFGRQAAAASKSLALATEDKAVFDAIAASLALLDNAIASGNELQVDVVGALPAGDNNIGNVDVVTLPALPAGTNNIGDVDVLTVPADPFGANADAASATGSISAKLRAIATALGATALDLGSGTGGSRTLRQFIDTAQWTGGAGAVSSAVQRVTHASDDPVTTALQIIDDWDESDRAKVNPIAGQAGVAAGSGTVSALTQRVVLATDVALPAGTNNIGDVDVLGGGVAHDGADSGNPVKIGGRAVSAEITPVANNDRADFVTDLAGKQIVLPYANPENFVSGAITSAMTGTTSTSLVASPGAGLRNYITTIICSNAHATVGTDIVIQDGSGGTTLLTIPAAAVYGGAVITLPVPLRQPTTATAIFCANVTTGASTKVSAVGYKGA